MHTKAEANHHVPHTQSHTFHPYIHTYIHKYTNTYKYTNIRHTYNILSFMQAYMYPNTHYCHHTYHIHTYIHITPKHASYTPKRRTSHAYRPHIHTYIYNSTNISHSNLYTIYIIHICTKLNYKPSISNHWI